MAERFSSWDLNLLAPDAYTPWDNPVGDPLETKWDLRDIPDLITRTFFLVVRQASNHLQVGQGNTRLKPAQGRRRFRVL